MKAKSVLFCLVAALTLGACTGQKPLLPECSGNNCRAEKPALEPV